MKPLRFKQVDVFTDRPFRGNPVAVVVGAEGLSSEEMQRIAGWTNLSETTFLLKSDKADYRLRIFTPRQELPFAGHPTLGSAHAALEAGFVEKKPRITQECGAGIISLSLEDGRLFLRAPQPRIAPVEKLIPSIPLAPGAKVLRIDVGPVWIVGEMSDAAALAALAPDMTALAEWTNSLEATGVTVFAPSGESASAIHVRSFAPAHGIPEDPVCGSGNISVAAYMREVKKQTNTYVARQGMQVGRDGRVTVRVSERDIEIGGHAVTCVEGTLRTA